MEFRATLSFLEETDLVKRTLPVSIMVPFLFASLQQAGCGGGLGACTRTCDAIQAELYDLNDQLDELRDDDGIDPCGPEFIALYCRTAELGLEAYDCNCEEAQTGLSRSQVVDAKNRVCQGEVFGCN
jgi:hypothetical protein